MLKIADTIFQSRLFIGSGKFSNSSLMTKAIQASGSQLVTISMKRIDLKNKNDDILAPLQRIGIKLLPNTSGAKNAQQALFAARLARDALETNWIKLEIHPDIKYLLPDPIETLKAAELLIREGFIVLPYCGADPVLCRYLEEVGCAALMPLGAPIGTNKGLITRDFLRIIIEQSTIPVIVDAGLGAPSHALAALEMGANAVLVNTAIAVANDPIAMAHAFRIATEAGDIARAAGLSAQQHRAASSSPLTQFLEAFK